MSERFADRGVSEVISFALVFSLITATVALVYVSGIGGLEATRSAEQVNNAERAFDVLADNIEDIHREAAPSRATEIKVSDAQMQFGDSVRFNVTVRNKFGDNISVATYDPIVYSAASGPDIVYANGALFRESGSGAVMNRDPTFLLAHEENDPAIDTDDEKTVVLPVIQTRKAGSASVGSQRTVLVRTLLATREVTIDGNDPGTLSQDPDGDGNNEFNSDALDPDEDGGKEYEVTIRIQPPEPRQDIWLEYINDLVDEQEADAPDGAVFDVRDIDGDGDLDETGDPACELIDGDGDGDEDTIECSLAAENVHSTVTRVDVIYR